MPLVDKIENEYGLIGVWELKESTDELLRKYKFHQEDLERLETLKHEKRRKEFLAARVLIQLLLPDNSGIEYQPKTGKPFLKNSDLHVSISHSADFACVFISKKIIGVDIEQTNRNVDRIAKRFLHPTEIEFIATLKNQQYARIMIWAAKEAIFKSTKEQGILFNKQIIIDPLHQNNRNVFTGQLRIKKQIIKYQLYYRDYSNNVLVYCVKL